MYNLKKFIKLLLPFFYFSLFLQANAQWQTLQTPSNTTLADLSIPSANLVWVVGWNSVIIRTTNGGENWERINNPPASLDNAGHIFAIDINTAWWVGGQNTERIFKTTNGGINWTEQFYYPRNFINGIHFFNASTGIILTDQVNGICGFFITRDGGNTWYRSPNSPVVGNNPLIDNCLGAIDTNLVWFRGFTANASRLFKLTGGLDNTWQVYPFLNNMGMTYALFKDSSTALATDGLKVIISTDGGINWSIRNDTVLPHILYQGSFILVPNTNWVIISSRKTRISYDFCESWQPVVNLDADGYMRAFDTNNIYVAGNSGKVYKHNFEYIGLKKITINIPHEYKLYQNYPNPFNPITKIKFDIPANSKQQISNVKLTIYDILGREVTTLVNEALKPGTYESEFDGTEYPSGVYYYKLQTSSYSETKRMVLVK